MKFFNSIILAFYFAIIMPSCIYSQELKSLPNNYFIIIDDEVSVKDNPKKDSNEIKKLRAGHRVIKIKESKKGKNEKWIYIDIQIFDKNKVTIKGWVLIDSIADLKDFKKVESFKDCYIKYGLGDCGLLFQFYKNGKFTSDAVCFYENNGKPIRQKGCLYKYNRVYYAGEFFYLKENAGLCTAAPLPEFCSVDGIKKN
jgi:hypothetical protein